MSKTLISLLVVLFLLVAGAGLWWFGVFDSLSAALNLNILQEETPAVEQTPQAPAPQSELTTGANSSDQALEQDEAQLDAQLEAYGEVSSELDQSLSDEPVEQDPNF